MSMVYEIEITASAYDDIHEAFNYYKEISDRLGQNFYEDLLRQLFYVQTNPTYYSFYKENFRKKLLSRFPYLVIYNIMNDRVVVYAVVYGGKDPAKISKKIS
jgi:plasmid stabilization system protein ParE